MAVNNRIFFATHAVGIGINGVAAPGDPSQPSGFIEAHGVQSVGLDTTFTLEPTFELGQLSIYENIEGIPDVEATAQKVLDGYPLLYHLASQDATLPTLIARTNSQSQWAMSVYPDTQDNASGTPVSSVGLSGMFISSLSYTFPVEGSATEDLTTVGNDKKWALSGFAFLPSFDGTDEPLSITGSGGVNRREDVLMGSGADASVWPTLIPGIDANGFNVESGGAFPAHIQTVTVSADLGRTELFELGRRGTYFRSLDVPVEVTTAIEIVSTQGDLVDALADPPGGSNLTDETVIIKLREGCEVNLGVKNKLASITSAGGDTGGGNRAITYNMVTQNDMTIRHAQDPAGFVPSWI